MVFDESQYWRNWLPGRHVTYFWAEAVLRLERRMVEEDVCGSVATGARGLADSFLPGVRGGNPPPALLALAAFIAAACASLSALTLAFMALISAVETNRAT